MKRNQPATEITKPVVELPHGIRLFVLKENETFRIPGVKETSPRALDYGPSLIFQQNEAGILRTDIHHVNDPEIWTWIGWLMHVGMFVVTGDQATQLPEHLREQKAFHEQLNNPVKR